MIHKHRKLPQAVTNTKQQPLCRCFCSSCHHYCCDFYCCFIASFVLWQTPSSTKTDQRCEFVECDYDTIVCWSVYFAHGDAIENIRHSACRILLQKLLCPLKRTRAKGCSPGNQISPFIVGLWILVRDDCRCN